MIDQLVETAVQFPGYVNLDSVAKRYGIDPRRHTGEEYLHLVARVREWLCAYRPGDAGWKCQPEKCIRSRSASQIWPVVVVALRA